MEDLTRRAFVGAMGAAGAAAVGATTAICAASAKEPTASGSAVSEGELKGWDGTTPPELEALGLSTMSLYEINRRRHELVDSKGDYTCADGRVIPAVFVKLRALTNTYHVGCGSEVTDECFDFFMNEFSEDEAEAYLEMPFGTYFTALDYATESGRGEDECLEICERLASRGLLGRTRRAGVAYFHQVALAHGFYEFGLNKYFQDGWTERYSHAWTGDYRVGYMDSGTPFYYAIPVDQQVVADEEILIGDDFNKILDRNSVFAVAPCQCRKIGMAMAGEDEPPAVGSEELKDFMAPCGHPLETCMAIGEMAEYYIENGIGREVDREEARAILQRSVDAGMILQESFTRDSYVICSCHGDCCRILGVYKAAGEEAFAACGIHENVSHYNLVHDKEACIKCGACVARCPMEAISMDDQTGYPVANAMCMRCGQCGLACPVGARKLEAKDPSAIPAKPADLVENYNLMAAYRFEHGTIY